jgi:hypothetical protein
MVSKGNHPQMAARFRLVKYYNLPRYIPFGNLLAIENGERNSCNIPIKNGDFP